MTSRPDGRAPLRHQASRIDQQAGGYALFETVVPQVTDHGGEFHERSATAASIPFPAHDFGFGAGSG